MKTKTSEVAGKRSVKVFLPPEKHIEYQVLALRQRITFSVMVETALDQYVSKHRKLLASQPIDPVEEHAA